MDLLRLAHEIADFGIYLKLGLSLAQAILANLSTVLWSLIGLYTGIGISDSGEEVTSWLNSLVVGMFLYVALVNVLPAMLSNLREFEIESGKVKGISFFGKFLSQMVGLVLGYLILFGIVVLFREKN